MTYLLPLRLLFLEADNLLISFALRHYALLIDDYYEWPLLLIGAFEALLLLELNKALEVLDNFIGPRGLNPF